MSFAAVFYQLRYKAFDIISFSQRNFTVYGNNAQAKNYNVFIKGFVYAFEDTDKIAGVFFDFFSAVFICLETLFNAVVIEIASEYL